MQRRQMILLIILLLVTGMFCGAQQQTDTLLEMSSKLQAKYLDAVFEKSAKATEQIDKQTEKYLAKLQKQEMKLKKKLSKIDSSAAKRIFENAGKEYKEMANKLKDKSSQLLGKTGKYLPWLDSAGTSLKYLQNNPLMATMKGGEAKLAGAVGKLVELKQQLGQATSVKDFIRQRKEYLKEQLRTYNLGSELKKYNQTAYYYSQQINEYRQVLSEPEKAEKKVLELLNKLPAFQQFMRKNSLLASLFSVPGADVPGALAQNLQGLQTNASVQQLIQNQIVAGGPNAMEAFQQSMNEAQGFLDKLKAKATQLGNNSGDELEMPNFKPNTQKSKGFLKRIEYSTNVQTAKSSYYFPTTSDIALSAGYKLSDKSIIGIGASYKMGWGKDIKHIALSSEGIGIRSFLDIKLKGGLYASGGFEYNYQQPFYTVRQLYSLDTWQRSGLVGLSKIVSLKTKYFKKTKIQILWDMLSYQQIPKTQAFKFRVGYSF